MFEAVSATWDSKVACLCFQIPVPTVWPYYTLCKRLRDRIPRSSTQIVEEHSGLHLQGDYGDGSAG